MASVQTLLRSLTASSTARRVSLLLVVFVAVLVAISLVLLSPLLLAAINPDGNTDWVRLADIAQTYAAVSAVLALLALGGVVVSLLLQAREMRANREQTLRVLHTELSRLALEDPLYLDCWGPVRVDMNDDQRRQHMYVNLIVSLWEMTYETRSTNEAQIRVTAARLFSGEPGQRFWRVARERRMAIATTKRSRRFQQILNEEYEKTTRPPPPPEPTTPSEPDPPAAPGGNESPNQESSNQPAPHQEASDRESPGHAP